MTGLDDAALLAVVAIGSAFAASALGQARWPRRSPAAAILLWQALGLASGLAAVGTLLGLAMPDSTTGVVRSVWYLAALFRTGGPFRVVGAFAAAGTVSMIVAAIRPARLAHGDPKVPGALVVDYPTAAAYCLPGLRSQIVVSVGALELLDPAELAAVL